MQKITTSFQVAHDLQGLRADQYLQRLIGRISRKRAQKIILAKDFLLNNKAVKKSQRLKLGEQVSLCRFAPDEKEEINNFNVEVVFENDDLLVVNKPYFLSIHPTANCLYKTLTFWLKKNYPANKINPCHRIDKETSGLVVCAKTKNAEKQIKTLFLKQQVKKTYLAIVHGHFKNSQIIDLPLALQKDRGLVAIRMIKDVLGSCAKTYIRAIKYLPDKNYTLVMCKPKTGRQHQIRAHLSLVGYPIVGDKLYGQADEFFDQYCKEGLVPKPLDHDRHCLHAYNLSFDFLGEHFRFRSNLLDDMVGLIL